MFSLRVAVAVTILAYVTSQVPIEEVRAAIATAEVVPIVAAFLLAFPGQLLVADRLRRLAASLGLVLGTARLFAIDLAARFYGLFLPAGNVTGAVIRYYSLAREEQNHVAVGLALALDRWIATVTLCGVGIGFGLLAISGARWPVLLALTAAFAALCLPLFAMVLPKGEAVRRRSHVRWPSKLGMIHDQIRRLRGLPRTTIAAVVVAGVIVHLLGSFAYALIALGLGIDLPYVDLVWIRSAALLAAILPISVAGLGVREGTLVVLLAQAGVGVADGLTFSLLVFAVTVLGVGLIGGAIEIQRLVVAPARHRPRQPG